MVTLSTLIHALSTPSTPAPPSPARFGGAVHAVLVLLSNLLPTRLAAVRERCLVAIYSSLGLVMMPLFALHVQELVSSSNDPLRWLSLLPLLQCALLTGGLTSGVRYWWCQAVTQLKVVAAVVLTLPPLCAHMAPESPLVFWALAGGLWAVGQGALGVRRMAEQRSRATFETEVLGRRVA